MTRALRRVVALALLIAIAFTGGTTAGGQGAATGTNHDVIAVGLNPKFGLQELAGDRVLIDRRQSRLTSFDILDGAEATEDELADDFLRRSRWWFSDDLTLLVYQSTTGFFVVPVDGSSPPVQLDAAVGCRPNFCQFEMSPDNQWVVYAGVDRRTHLARVDGSVPTRVAFGGQSLMSSWFTSDSSTVVMRGQKALYAFPVAGATEPTLLAFDPDDNLASSVDISDDDQWVLFANRGWTGPRTLKLVPIDGSAPPVIVDDIDSIIDFFLLGDQVIYRAAPVGSGNLFARPIDLSSPRRFISGFVANNAMEPSDDESELLFLTTDGLNRIWSQPSDGSSAPVVVSGDPAAIGGVVDSTSTYLTFFRDDWRLEGIVFTPETWIEIPGGRMVFVTLVGDKRVIWMGSLDGSAEPFRLSHQIPGGAQIESAAVAEGGSRMVYEVELHSGKTQLFSVDLDSPGAAVLASRPERAGEGIGDFLVSNDGSRLVYQVGPPDAGQRIVTVNLDGPVCANILANRYGSDGDDSIGGTIRSDVIAGLGGDDEIRARAGNDTVCGGPGDDLLLLGDGFDIGRGGRGGDEIVGGAGRDTLLGSPGRDVLRGGAAMDQLDGQGGVDVCNGGPNVDTAQRCETELEIP